MINALPVTSDEGPPKFFAHVVLPVVASSFIANPSQVPILVNAGVVRLAFLK